MDAFHHLLDQLRPALLRAARHQLRNPTWAEDAVSETLLAAVQRPPGFTEAERVRAWLFGILRHKVVDQWRQQLKPELVTVPDEAPDGEPAEPGDPCPMADPMHRVASRQFLGALQRQLLGMPRLPARAFVLRDCLGEETETICQELAISAGHLWVLLHRARRQLRQALAAHHAG